jgi:hypothetical protein
MKTMTERSRMGESRVWLRKRMVGWPNELPQPVFGQLDRYSEVKFINVTPGQIQSNPINRKGAMIGTSITVTTEPFFRGADRVPGRAVGVIQNTEQATLVGNLRTESNYNLFLNPSFMNDTILQSWTAIVADIEETDLLTPNGSRALRYRKIGSPSGGSVVQQSVTLDGSKIYNISCYFRMDSGQKPSGTRIKFFAAIPITIPDENIYEVDSGWYRAYVNFDSLNGATQCGLAPPINDGFLFGDIQLCVVESLSSPPPPFGNGDLLGLVWIGPQNDSVTQLLQAGRIDYTLTTEMSGRFIICGWFRSHENMSIATQELDIMKCEGQGLGEGLDSLRIYFDPAGVPSAGLAARIIIDAPGGGANDIDETVHSNIVPDFLEWTHVCVICTGNAIRFYIDGQIIGSPVSAAPLPAESTLIFGNGINGEYEAWRIWQYSTVDDELVENIYNAEKSAITLATDVIDGGVLWEWSLNGNGRIDNGSGFIDASFETSDQADYAGQNGLFGAGTVIPLQFTGNITVSTVTINANDNGTPQNVDAAIYKTPPATQVGSVLQFVASAPSKPISGTQDVVFDFPGVVLDANANYFVAVRASTGSIGWLTRIAPPVPGTHDPNKTVVDVGPAGFGPYGGAWTQSKAITQVSPTFYAWVSVEGESLIKNYHVLGGVPGDIAAIAEPRLTMANGFFQKTYHISMIESIRQFSLPGNLSINFFGQGIGGILALDNDWAQDVAPLDPGQSIDYLFSIGEGDVFDQQSPARIQESRLIRNYTVGLLLRVSLGMTPDPCNELHEIVPLISVGKSPVSVVEAKVKKFTQQQNDDFKFTTFLFDGILIPEHWIGDEIRLGVRITNTSVAAASPACADLFNSVDYMLVFPHPLAIISPTDSDFGSFALVDGDVVTMNKRGKHAVIDGVTGNEKYPLKVESDMLDGSLRAVTRHYNYILINQGVDGLPEHPLDSNAIMDVAITPRYGI